MKFQSSIRILLVLVFIVLMLILPRTVFGETVFGENEGTFALDDEAQNIYLTSNSATDTPTGVVNAGVLNVRSGPGVSFKVITKIYNGQLVSILGRYYANNWVQIRLSNGLEGWVNSVYLNMSQPLNSLPVIGTPPTTPVPPIVVTPVAVVTTGALNVRSGPSPYYQSLTVVFQGNELTIIGRNKAATWLKVTTSSNVEGWVNAYYVQTSVPVSSLPVVETPAVVPTAIITASSINVHSGPGVEYSVIAILYQGQSVRVTGRNTAGDWLQILLGNGQTGWLTTSSAQLNIAVPSLPVIETEPPVNTAVVNTGALNVRSGPGIDYDAFAVIYGGQVVTLVARAPSSTWVQVRLAGGAAGWVNSNYLLMSVPLSSLPIVY